MSQAGGQFPETRSVLAAIVFAFVRHRLGDVSNHHQVSDDLSRIVAHRRNSRTKTLSGMFAADLFVFGAASLAAQRAGAELRNGPGLVRAAEDLGAGRPTICSSGAPIMSAKAQLAHTMRESSDCTQMPSSIASNSVSHVISAAHSPACRLERRAVMILRS